MTKNQALTPLEAVNEIRNNNNGQVVLVLQGGGALGAYQGGVYQALHEAGVEPDWIIGTSIGAINAAIIAGNKPEDRLAKLQEFWRRVERSDASGARFPAWTGVADALVVMDDADHRHPRLLRDQSPRLPWRAMCRSAPTMPATIRPSPCARRSRSSSTSPSSIKAIRGSPWARRMCAPA